MPGTLTTAFLTLKLLFESIHATNRLVYEVVPFDEIIPAVAAGKYDAGLIIHEGQLTFQNQGLHLVVDLGVWWQDQTGLPLPLGGNVVRKDLGDATMKEISRLIKESIQYGLAHREEALRLRPAVRPRHGRDARGQVRRHVRERLDARLRRRTAAPRSGDCSTRPTGRTSFPTPVAVEFVE